jgi:parallel beta-helix repeat protein
LIAESRYGLVIQNGSSPSISDNLIRNGEAGVFCWTNSSPELRNNQIAGNEEEGLFIDRSCSPLLDDNRILKNDIGLAAYDSKLRALVGSLAGNREDFRQLREEGSR